MSQKEIATAKLQTQAYDALSSYLQAHNNQIIEIEVLPPAIQPPNGLLMHDGLSVGIPKKILALAYVEARKRFFHNVKDEDSQSLALQATKVMLLFDPEHLTAANFRKRRLVTLQAGTTLEDKLAFRKSVKYEFCFLDSILTSPLHRQSKSPTLWHHRFWLLELLGPKSLKGIPEDFWRTELRSVCKSGERHPKNYYAWQYARKLVMMVDGMDATFEFARSIKDWCCKHPSDISGWSCLTFIIPHVEPPAERQDLVREVLDYAINLRSEHESLWVFIRTILAEKTLQDGQIKLVSMLRDYDQELKSADGQCALSVRIRQTLDWITKYGTPDTPDTFDSGQMSSCH